nr:LytTR family DNA-binding domain-containing protein [Verrucomicrobiota bacterium JB025]
MDDMKVERMMLKHLVMEAPPLEWVGEADGVEAAVELIRERQPEVIFLDVEMPGADGFELLEQLEQVPQVVFVSSSASHAVEAFSCEAVDYLLKPVMPERFDETVRRLERQSARAREAEADVSLCVRTLNGTSVLALSDILAVKANGDFCWVYQRDQPRLFVSKRLGELDDDLPKPPFFRVDRSLVINMKALAKVERKDRQASRLRLDGVAEALEVGRTATARLLKLMRDTTAGGKR